MIFVKEFQPAPWHAPQLVITYTVVSYHACWVMEHQHSAESLSSFQIFRTMVCLFTLFVSVGAGRFGTMTKVPLLIFLGHYTQVEASNSSAVRPCYVTFHRQTAKMPHPPRHLVDLRDARQPNYPDCQFQKKLR